MIELITFYHTLLRYFKSCLARSQRTAQTWHHHHHPHPERLAVRPVQELHVTNCLRGAEQDRCIRESVGILHHNPGLNSLVSNRQEFQCRPCQYCPSGTRWDGIYPIVKSGQPEIQPWNCTICSKPHDQKESNYIHLDVFQWEKVQVVVMERKPHMRLCVATFFPSVPYRTLRATVFSPNGEERGGEKSIQRSPLPGRDGLQASP